MKALLDDFPRSKLRRIFIRNPSRIDAVHVNAIVVIVGR
jgi:hypothetical protein